MCIKVIFSIRRIGNMYLRYLLSLAYFRGQGFLFYFLLAAYPFISHSIRKKHHSCFCPQRGISARFPACLLLPIAAGTDTCRMLCAKPAVELPVMTLHAGLFGPPLAPFCRFNVKGVAGLPTSCRHYGESVPACVLRTRPSEARRFMFYFSLLLLGEVTIIFRRKDSVRSGAA